MIVIVFGLPASGKSSFARRLTDELDAVYLNVDIVRLNLDLQGRFDEESTQKVYDQILFELVTQVQYKRHVVIDGIFHQDDIRRKFIDKARQYEQDIYFIELKATDRTIRKRLSGITNLEGGDGDAEANFKIYLQMKLEFDQLEQPHLVLWSDDSDVEKLVIMAREHILS
jgi:predicted kinase